MNTEVFSRAPLAATRAVEVATLNHEIRAQPHGLLVHAVNDDDKAGADFLFARPDASALQPAIATLQTGSSCVPSVVQPTVDAMSPTAAFQAPSRAAFPAASCISDEDASGSIDLQLSPGGVPVGRSLGSYLHGAPHHRSGDLEIYVKTLSGNTITLAVRSSDSIDVVKTQVQDKEGIPPDRQSLIFAGKLLVNSQTLGNYGICNKHVLHLSVCLLGGMQACADGDSNISDELRGSITQLTQNDPRMTSLYLTGEFH
jgi:hypothetical protein